MNQNGIPGEGCPRLIDSTINWTLNCAHSAADNIPQNERIYGPNLIPHTDCPFSISAAHLDQPTRIKKPIITDGNINVVGTPPIARESGQNRHSIPAPSIPKAMHHSNTRPSTYFLLSGIKRFGITPQHRDQRPLLPLRTQHRAGRRSRKVFAIGPIVQQDWRTALQ